MRTMAKLLLAVAAGTFFSASAQAQGQAAIERSRSSVHWNLMGIYGEADKRAAVLIDRETITDAGSPRVREFNYYVTVEGMPKGGGIISRMRVYCDGMARVDLGKVEYFGGTGNFVAPKSGDRLVIKPEASVYPALVAVCTGNWAGLAAIDLPFLDLQAAAFKR